MRSLAIAMMVIAVIMVGGLICLRAPRPPAAGAHPGPHTRGNDARAAGDDGATRGALRGLVRTADGHAAADVVIVVARADGGEWAREVRSDRQGRFHLASLPPGLYLVTATGADGHAAIERVLIDAGERSLILTLDGLGYRVSGVVSDSGGGTIAHAIVSARVGLLVYEAAAATNGAYSLRLPPGYYALTARAAGYGPSRPRPIILGADKEVDIALSPGTVVGGLVVDDHDRPLPGVTVELSLHGLGPTRTTIADERGRFEWADAGPGEYWLAGYGNGRCGRQTLTVTPGNNRNVVLRLGRGRALSGRILDARGQPAAGAVVSLIGPPDAFATLPSAVSDASGRYRLDGLEPAEYQVSAVHARLGRDAANVSIDGDGERDFRLRALVNVAVTVTHADGAPVVGAQVELAAVPGFERHTRASDARGLATFAVTPGRVRVAAVDEAAGQARREAEIDGDAALALRLDGDGVIAGAVAWDDGEPAAGVRVTLGGAALAWPMSVTADARGQFAFAHLDAGLYSVDASLAALVFTVGGSDRPEHKTVQLDAHGERRRLGLVLARETHELRGTVYADEGRAANVQIVVTPATPRPFWGLAREPVFSGPDGVFRVTDLPAGRFRLEAISEVYGKLEVTAEADQSGVVLDYRSIRGGIGTGRP